MTRKDFLKLSATLLASPLFANNINSDKKPMPSLFIGHGSPMNIIRDNDFTNSLKNISKTFNKPKAIIVLSAHWYKNKTIVSNSKVQNTIYDFYGFPQELYNISYNAKGHPSLANSVAKLFGDIQTQDRGLDHGAWSVLKHLYPDANIPTFQISMNQDFHYSQHFAFGSLLSKLREQGVLIIGSGNVTHNLALRKRNSKNIDSWAVEFDSFIKNSFLQKNYSNLINAKEHPLFRKAHPYDDHFVPMLYLAGTVKKEDKIEFFHEDIVSSNLSMRCIKIG